MKRIITLSFIFLIILFSCSDKNESFIRINEYDLEVIEYFPQVTLGFDNSETGAVTRKWGKEMKIYVYGTVSNSNLDEVKKVGDEINQLTTDGFSISITQDSIQADLYLFLGSKEEYGIAIPFFESLIENFSSYFYLYWNSNNQIYLSFCYVDTSVLDPARQSYQIRQVITRSLGFTRHPYSYSTSIFNGDYWSGQRDYSKIDRDVIRLMYHPDMEAGLVAGDSLKNLLLTILMNEK